MATAVGWEGLKKKKEERERTKNWAARETNESLVSPKAAGRDAECTASVCV